MKRGAGLTRRKPMPPPATPMPRGTGLSRTAWSPVVHPLLSGSKSAATTRSETGFSRSTKLQVRTRAGAGDPDKALCESCGLWLGRRHGQVHHVIGRGMGGCKDALLNSPANAALLCGTPYAGCHGLATALDREIGARGFWLLRGTDPRMVPMMLASKHGSGVLVWRSVDGSYLLEAPEAAA